MQQARLCVVRVHVSDDSPVLVEMRGQAEPLAPLNPGTATEDGAAAAAAAEAHARGAGTGGVVAALQRAEQQHEQEQAGGSKKARLLAKLGEGGGGTAKPASAAGASSLPPELCQSAAIKLAAVLGSNTALSAELRSRGAVAAVIAAALVEQLTTSKLSKPVFQSKLSNLAMQLKKAAAAGDVPALAAALANCSGDSAGQPGGAVQTLPAGGAAGGAEADLVATAAPGSSAQQLLLQQVAKSLRLAAAASPSPSPGSATTSEAAVASATAALHALEAAPVTVDWLQSTGAGKQVQQLKRHGAPAVAAAAAAVVAAWKARLTAAGVR